MTERYSGPAEVAFYDFLAAVFIIGVGSLLLGGLYYWLEIIFTDYVPQASVLVSSHPVAVAGTAVSVLLSLFAIDYAYRSRQWPDETADSDDAEGDTE